MTGIDVHPVAAWIALEQGDLAVTEAVLVLLQVLRGNPEQRALFGIRIGVLRAAAGELHMGRSAAPLAGPARNAAVGVTGTLRADGREILIEASQLGLAERGLGQGAQAEQAGEHKGRELRLAGHGMFSGCLGEGQKLYLAFRAMWSRSLWLLYRGLPR